MKFQLVLLGLFGYALSIPAPQGSDNKTISIEDCTIPKDNGLIGSKCIADKFCVYSQPDCHGHVFVTLFGSEEGYVAFSSSTTMVVISNLTISDRDGNGKITNPVSYPVALRVPKPDWAVITMTIVRPLKTSDYAYSSDTKFSWSVSKTVPDFDPNSILPPPDRQGPLGSLDLTEYHSTVATEIGSSGEGNYGNINIHAYLMLFAWLICPLIMVFVERYFKSQLSPAAYFNFRIIAIAGGCLGMSVISILFVYVSKAKPGMQLDSKHSMHSLLGLIATILIAGCLGVEKLSAKWKVERRSQVMWISAVCLAICAVATIWTGILLSEYLGAYNNAFPFTILVICTLAIGTFAFAERLKRGKEEIHARGNNTGNDIQVNRRTSASKEAFIFQEPVTATIRRGFGSNPSFLRKYSKKDGERSASAFVANWI